MLFAKFTAMYTETTQQLAYTTMAISQNELKSDRARHIQLQIMSIMRQRETNLIPQLKVKLGKIAKQVQGTKHKMRYIWELIIQGNINEVESVVQRACTAVDECEADFLRLLREFPNSRFVARSYARFLRDVVADHAEHKVWVQNAASLQRGISVTKDQSQLLGLKAFPMMPKALDIQHSAIQQTQILVGGDVVTLNLEADD